MGNSLRDVHRNGQSAALLHTRLNKVDVELEYACHARRAKDRVSETRIYMQAGHFLGAAGLYWRASLRVNRPRLTRITIQGIDRTLFTLTALRGLQTSITTQILIHLTRPLWYEPASPRDNGGAGASLC